MILNILNSSLPSDIVENVNPFNSFIESFLNWFYIHAPSILIAIILLFISWWLAGIVSKIALKAMKRSKLDISMISFLNSPTKVALKVVAVLIFMGALGVNVSTIVAALGAVGVTAGLAIKDSLSNVASGMLLVLHKPFNVGDYIELENTQGTVAKVEIMFTTLVTPDNKTVIIPNSVVASHYIINYTSNKTRRLDLIFSIGYNDSIEKARNVIKEVISLNDKIVNKEKSIIVVESHMASSIDLGVKVWCNSSDFLQLKYELQESVKSAFEKNNISIPYNQLDIHLVNSIAK